MTGNSSDDRPKAADLGQATSPIESPPAWERIDVGRYRPRRIRGSMIGRELG